MELPFQWDDGHFISPFVASSSDAVSQLGAWLHHSPILRGPTGALCRSLRLTDFGCGDGTVLRTLAAQLILCRVEMDGERRNVSPLHIHAVGVDLDADLIAVANGSMTETVPLPHSLRCEFVVEDICSCDVEHYFPPESEESPHILFLYLLPDALELIRDKLLEASHRVRFVVSNRWEIPFLEEWKIGQVDMMHVYHYTPENKKK